MTETRPTIHAYQHATTLSGFRVACGNMQPGELATWPLKTLDAVTCDACLTVVSPQLQRLGEYETGPA